MLKEDVPASLKAACHRGEGGMHRMMIHQSRLYSPDCLCLFFRSPCCSGVVCSSSQIKQNGEAGMEVVPASPDEASALALSHHLFMT